ncbi:PrsW family intramembrane metalloprotease [Salipaludibacillus neizhouensis]|uniref:Protease PrsW n=1 Tax=Salipaludibacillus neizhouensis TaxID=885475 RepID=A0A3A9KIU7_9BACI|nr:glutamic-type intramembrane protease PrsW [Salipaludibacillus neizhouensis]RKL67615.1 PrsW family intramembrane metalloprotease [Salipaludibacillus neizhouensis]
MLSIITVAITPAIALLIFFYLKDEFEQEPVLMVIRCFIFGALLVFPVMFIQFVITEETTFNSSLLITFFQVAFVEEFIKWFIVLVAVFYHVHFNQRYDGIVYSTAVALGFASIENILFILANGLDTAFYRAIFPVTSHALFGVVMGYYFGKAKFHINKRNRYLFLALFIPIVLHGFYNLILASLNHWIYALAPFMVCLWIVALRNIKKANQNQALHIIKDVTG